MKRIIENDFLKVTIDDHGAELVSIYDKEKDREVIWQGDPKFWGRHAPVLFPNVGKHYNNHYRIHGQEYASKQHGFARDTDFTCIDSIRSVLPKTPVRFILLTSCCASATF